MAFELKEAKVLGEKSTIARDVFVELLKTKGGFVEVPSASTNYMSFRFKAIEWLFVRAYASHYQLHLMGDYDSYVVKKKEYDQFSAQPETFLMTNILKG